jgi:hypothetical protein
MVVGCWLLEDESSKIEVRKIKKPRFRNKTRFFVG